MQDDIVAKYERWRVPRYTSYPTAPHFTGAVDASVYRGWLAALPPAARLSLYLHVPFCRSMCWYCGCHTRIVRGDEPIVDYVEALRREIEIVADCLPRRMAVDHVHWGGGTPTILAPDAFERVMDLVRRRFALGPDAEVAVEIDPRRITGAMVRALAAGGVTRASLGVQTFDSVVQQAINRIQSFEQTRSVTEALREAGIGAINFDLLYGLPHQTVASCIGTVERAVSLAPSRFAVFGYAHVPWMKKHQRLIDEAALPDGRERLRQFQAIAERLDGAGYARVGLDHFARENDALARALRTGGLRRNFQGYTTDRTDALIGFGASAIGVLPQGYVQNVAQTGAYQRWLGEGALAVQRGVALTPEDRLRSDVIEQIMCYQRVDLAAAARRHGCSLAAFAPDRPALARLEADGVIRVTGPVVEIVPRHALLMRSVAAAFDAYLRPDEMRHARAI